MAAPKWTPTRPARRRAGSRVVARAEREGGSPGGRRAGEAAGGGAVFDARYPATADAVASARHQLWAFVRRSGGSERLAATVSLALSEAVTNAVVHAYADRPEPGTVDVSARLVGDELWVTVADAGCGVPHARPGAVGLGMAIIGRLADTLRLAHPPEGGFEVQMRFALEPRQGRPAA